MVSVLDRKEARDFARKARVAMRKDLLDLDQQENIPKWQSAPGYGLRLLDPECDGNQTVLCRKLSRGEAMPRTAKGATIADRTANPKAIA